LTDFLEFTLVRLAGGRSINDERIPIGNEAFYFRREGELLHAEREDLKTLYGLRNQLGSYTFKAQYQQRPEAPDGEFFKKTYLQLIEDRPQFQPDGRLWVSVDAALSTSATADYSAITFGCSDENGHFILHTERGRLDYEALRAKVMVYAKRYPDVTFVVEAAASGISLLEYLGKQGLRTCRHTARESKVARAAFVLPIFEEGRVFILNREGRNAWVEPLVNEFLTFPNGKFDDQVDSVVQAVRWAEPLVNPRGQAYLC